MQAGVEIDGIQIDPTTGNNYTVGDNMPSKLGDKSIEFMFRPKVLSLHLKESCKEKQASCLQIAVLPR